MKSVEWTPMILQSFDAVLITTDHSAVDWEMLVENAQLVIDTRNALNNWQKKYGDKIVKA